MWLKENNLFKLDAECNKTENQKSYRFGNQLNYAGTSSICTRKIVSIVPQLVCGEVYESTQHNQEIQTVISLWESWF
jgi:hypothetical protein